MVEEEVDKLYYSIGEVSRRLGIEQHVLRFWETEFKELTPRKRKGGKRLYKPADLKLVERIKQLLYEERYTIEGARKQLKLDARGGRETEDGEKDSKSARTVDSLQEIREGLLEIRSILESMSLRRQGSD